MCVGCKVDVILSDQDPQVPLEPSRGQGQNASVTTYFRFSNLWKKNCLSSFDKIFCTSRSPEIDFHANFSVKSHSAVISRFFSGCKVDVILSDQDPKVHGQEAWSMADLLQDDGSAYTDVYPSECQLDHSVF